jgi:Ca2+-binding EF-hand superfamily protein
MRNAIATALISTLTTALSLPVLAQDAARPGAGMGGPTPFAQFDRNGDGSVSESEFNQTRAERIAARSQAGAPMRGMANAPAFGDIDQNGDGQLTPSELADFRAQRMGNRSGMGPGMGMGAGGMGPGMGRMGGQMPTFSSFDADGDGLLSEVEFAQGRAERIKERSQQGYQMRNLANAPSFDAIDQNSDGQIDKQEFERAQMQHRQMMQP